MEKKEVNINCLLGKTIKKIEKFERDGEIFELIFYVSDNERYEMYGDPGDLLYVYIYIESITGDLNDLIDSPILLAEEVTNEDICENKTWTFYKLATKKGYVDIRWYGTSNGYYSEKAGFRLRTKNNIFN